MPSISSANDFCPDVYAGGTLALNFNPTFIHVDKMNFGAKKYDGLVISSFFNAIKPPDGSSAIGYFERDLVARITGIGYRAEAWWNPNQAEILSDLDEPSPQAPNAIGQTIWPNEAQRVPDGILPFESIVVPEGFHTTAPGGRITLINLDDPARETYIVDESIQVPGETPCQADDSANFNPLVRPRFYHLVKWADMNGNGLQDAVTVRSGFKVSGAFCFPLGEVVWFENPGAAIDPAVEWVEHIVAGVDFANTPGGEDSRYAADISLDIADLDGDGIVEIIGGTFFTSGSFFTATDKAIEIYGVPAGATSWVGVNPDTNPAQIAIISTNTDNGPTFGLRFVDLNRDGKLDILATNHQTDNCFSTTQSVVPGRVYALEQPASGDLFNDTWVQHTLKDDIRPNPSFPASADDLPGSPGRLAPGLALEMWPTPFDENFKKPWVLVGGDEASKVWLLKPTSEDPNDWNYDSSVIFDINDFYGPNTSQSFTAPAPATGVSISTIGGPTWRYDRDWAWGAYAEIYIPVFEGRDIHRITFRPLAAEKKITCPPDGQLACPVF